jgi:hypothetical protein
VQALLHKRRSELQQQQQKRAELQQDVLAEEGRQVGSVEACRPESPNNLTTSQPWCASVLQACAAGSNQLVQVAQHKLPLGTRPTVTAGHHVLHNRLV